MHYAASIPHEEGVYFQLIRLAKWAKLSQRDKFFLTPRSVARESRLPKNLLEIDRWVLRNAAEGRIDELKELLLEGYDIMEAEDSSGKNILEVAALNKQENMVEFLNLASAFEVNLRRSWTRFSFIGIHFISYFRIVLDISFEAVPSLKWVIESSFLRLATALCYTRDKYKINHKLF